MKEAERWIEQYELALRLEKEVEEMEGIGLGNAKQKAAKHWKNIVRFGKAHVMQVLVVSASKRSVQIFHPYLNER